jgi:hypothetical protein
MGKVLKAKTVSTQVDWFARASHISQVFLLVLAGVGYFYTVLPVYQKALLDEEIAQKTILLNEREKRVAELNLEISNRQRELVQKDRQVLAAKFEARENYIKLRQEYINAALTVLRNCNTSFFIKDEINESGFSKCPEFVEQSLGYMFRSLKPQDVQLFMSILKEKTAEAEPEYQRIVSEYRTNMDAAKVKKAEELEKQRQDSEDSSGVKAYLRTRRMMIERNNHPAQSVAIAAFQKLLNKTVTEVNTSFFSRAPT